MSAHTKPTRDDVIALETAFWDAMKTKDGDKAAQMSGKAALVTGDKGVMRIGKADMGRMTVEGNWKLESYVFDDIEVSVPTPDVAIIAYKVTEKVEMDGKRQNLEAADSSTWIRGDDGWECHAHSEVIMKQKEAA